MNTKPFFLPSEVARLVLGYLISQGFDQTSRRFLIECDYLAEFRKLQSMGLEYPTNILGLSLIEILDNFGFMKTQALERYNIMASTDTLWREMDSCLDKLKYKMLQSSSNKLNVPKIRTNRKIADRNVKVLPENIGEMILKQGKVLSSKQLAQTIKKAHEAINMQNENLKENHVENSSSSPIGTTSSSSSTINNHFVRQDLQRHSLIPVRKLPETVEHENFVEETEAPVIILAESNENNQIEKNDQQNHNNNNNNGDGETTSADKINLPQTEYISKTSPPPRQMPSCHTPTKVDHSPAAPISKTPNKQPDSENPTACVSTSVSQLSSSSEHPQVVTVEPGVTTVPQEGISVSVSSPSKVSVSGCDAPPPPTETHPLYHSVGTQSDFSVVTSSSQPATSSDKPGVTTPVETIVPLTNTGMPVATPSKSLPIPKSNSNMELSPNTNTLQSPMEVTPISSDELPVESHNDSNQENDQSTDSLLKESNTAAVEAASLSLSSSPPSLLLGISSGISSKSFPSVYKTPVKNLPNPYRSPGKDNSQHETLNTPTRDKNTSFPESFTPVKQSDADNAKSKRKRYPPEKRFVDIIVPGPSQVRSESGNSQDSCHLKDQIPTFVEKVITETSLPEVLAKTINRKLYGEAKNEVTARSSENKNIEDGQKVECDKLMDEIMLTDFHMTKSDIDEVIHQTSSAGIPVLDDLLKLFASVSEEKDNPSDEDCAEQVLDGVEFEGLDSCSQSAQNKEIKLVTSEDDLSKSDLKTITTTGEMSSLNKPPTTFLQVVDKLCLSKTSTEQPSSNQAGDDLSHKAFSTTLEEQEQNSENKMLLASESAVKDLQTSENNNSLDNSKQDQTSFEAKEVSVPKHPSSCSRRSKVFSKGKSRKLIPPPVLKTPNKNPAPMPPNSPASLSSFTPVPSPLANVMPSDTHSQPSQSITTTLRSDTHSNITPLTSQSTTETTTTSSNVLVPISSNICSSVDKTLSKISTTNTADSSSRTTLTNIITAPVTVPTELPVKDIPAITSASLLNNPTAAAAATTQDPPVLQANENSYLLVQQPLLSSEQQRSTNKIFSASISESNSVVSRVIQPDLTAAVTKYPVMYIIGPPPPPSNMPLQNLQTHTLVEGVSNFVYPNVQPPWIADKTVLSMTIEKRSESQQKSQRKAAKPKKPRGRPKKDPKKVMPSKPKIQNIAPNRDLNTLISIYNLDNSESQLNADEMVTLAVPLDKSWTIEMKPGTEEIVLTLKSPQMQQLVSYTLTSKQVSDHLSSFIGTTEITDHILKCMKKLSRFRNKPNILSPRRGQKSKKTQKITLTNQLVTTENCNVSESNAHPNNGCPTPTNESKQVPSNVQDGEEQILYYAEPLGKIEDFLKMVKTESEESPKRITASSSSPASQVITDSQTSTVIIEKKSSPNLKLPSPKEETFVDKPDQKSPNCISDPPSTVSKEVSARSPCNDDPRTTDTPIKDNEYLAISILSTLCYSQSECCTKDDPVVDASPSKATTGQHLFCDVSASSPAKCYKILMGGKKEGQLVETPDKSAPALQEGYSDNKPSSNLSDIIGYVDRPTLEKARKGSSGLKRTNPSFSEEKETFINIDKPKSVPKKETKGSSTKKSLTKSPQTKIKKPVKRKLYDAFPDKELSDQKTTNKINRMDIDLLLTRLHPDSLDGSDGNS